MRLWILLGGGVLILAGALWPFGKRTEQLGPVPVTPTVAARTPTESPKPTPAPVIEVIDLARAYEPVREPEEPAGAVNPASFIQVPEGPQRIPPAIDLDNPYRDVRNMVREASTGSFLFGVRLPGPERIDVMPREVAVIQDGLLNFVPTPRADGELVFTPMGVPFAPNILQSLPPNASIVNGRLEFTPAEALKVMPRIVPARFAVERPDGKLDFHVERHDGVLVREGELRFVPMSIPYAVGITQPIPPNASIVRLIPLEELKMMPRVVPEPMSPAVRPVR